MKKAYTFDDLQIIPAYSKIDSRKDCDLTTTLVGNIKIHVPIISSPMDTVTEWEMIMELDRLGACGVLHRFMTFEETLIQLHRITTHFQIVAIGSKFKANEFHIIYNSGIRVFLIDVAHGHSKHVRNTITSMKNEYNDIFIIVGSIATYLAARDLIDWGADALRVGLGCGSLCETRIRTGVGIPQATAIMDVRKAIDDSGKNVQLIADGGIRTPGDAAKALALGADTIMLGSLLAGTQEAPGTLIRSGLFPNEQLFKLYRGSASQSSKISRGEEDTNIEGTHKQIPYKGKVKRIIHAMEDGIRSSMSYVGARNLTEFREFSEFVEITRAGQIEAQPHLLIKN